MAELRRRPLILVEPSDYILRNVGDMAMMRVALARLSTMWPDADIRVLSERPDELVPPGPNVTAIDAGGRHRWVRTPLLPAVVMSRLPRPAASAVRELSRWSRIHVPGVVVALHRLRRPHDRALTEHVNLTSAADLVIATGMGGITDVFPTYADELLETIESAQRRGAITALMGQGIGPLENLRLRRKAKRVLSAADLIALREGRIGRHLLVEGLGVPAERVRVTGDDAIELAQSFRADPAANAVGVNLRVADYAGLGPDAATKVGQAVNRAATLLGADLIPIAISCVPGEEDADSIDRFVGARSAAGGADIDSAIAAVAQCRVVVTGSYHAAVFAMALGIPAITIAASTYYEHKFLGLMGEFGVGCSVVFADEWRFTERLTDAILAAWDHAEDTRPGLLESAARQLDRSRDAYEEVRRLVDVRRDLAASGVRWRSKARAPVRYGSARLGLATVARKLTSSTDVRRWSDLGNYDVSWDARSKLIAELITPGSCVLEFGAGRRRLEAALHASSSYIPSDIVSRGPDTLVADLNERPLPNLSALPADVVVFAGVLEYVARVDEIVRWLKGEGIGRIVASYECADPCIDSVHRLRRNAERLRCGWINHYTEDEFVELFARNGYRCHERRTWSTPEGDERVFVFAHPGLSSAQR